MRIGANAPALAATTQPAGKPRYERFNDGVKLTAATTCSSAVGYGVGAVVGAVADSWGANYAYPLLAPAAGAAIAGMAGMAAQQDSKVLGKVALTSALAGAGCIVGDLVGHGLTALSGNPIYRNIGAAAGAVNGASLSFNISDPKSESKMAKIADYSTPAILGATGGSTLGCLTGALISYVTGNSFYSNAAPILGGVAGALTGLALAVNPPTAKPQRERGENGGY